METINLFSAAFHIVGFIAGIWMIPLLLILARVLGIYATVQEQQSIVYVLFGKVIGTLDQPGLACPIKEFGLKVIFVPFFGKRHKVNRQLLQVYLRNQPVNSDEGAPMGVGVWYEMKVDDPLAYLFKNSNPAQALAANISTTVIKRLSNLKVDVLLEDRHSLSREVRAEVLPICKNWGYRIGSTYLRKVSFTDKGMINQISEKVVNRLTQITSAMRQEGRNQVGLIESAAEKTAATKLAEADAVRPKIVGEVTTKLANDKDVGEAVFDILETERTLKSGSQVILGTESPVLVNLPAVATTS